MNRGKLLVAADRDVLIQENLLVELNVTGRHGPAQLLTELDPVAEEHLHIAVCVLHFGRTQDAVCIFPVLEMRRVELLPPPTQVSHVLFTRPGYGQAYTKALRSAFLVFFSAK